MILSEPITRPRISRVVLWVLALQSVAFVLWCLWHWLGVR